MDPMHDLYSWSKQRREEALGEARRRSVAKQAKGSHGQRFEPARVGSALSGVLSLLRSSPDARRQAGGRGDALSRNEFLLSDPENGHLEPASVDAVVSVATSQLVEENLDWGLAACSTS